MDMLECIDCHHVWTDDPAARCWIGLLGLVFVPWCPACGGVMTEVVGDPMGLPIA